MPQVKVVDVKFKGGEIAGYRIRDIIIAVITATWDATQRLVTVSSGLQFTTKAEGLRKGQWIQALVMLAPSKDGSRIYRNGEFVIVEGATYNDDGSEVRIEETAPERTERVRLTTGEVVAVQRAAEYEVADDSTPVHDRGDAMPTPDASEDTPRQARARRKAR